MFCQEELERWEVQRADDVRLDRHLYHACSAELRSVCADVEPGAREGRGIAGARVLHTCTHMAGWLAGPGRCDSGCRALARRP